DMLQKLALGKWNVTSMVVKESELVCEAERFQLKYADSPRRMGLALEPVSLRGVGHSSTLELPL
ncbi:hypothetical protein CRENBAI_006646, partial [Crenichthys baileyi]